MARFIGNVIGFVLGALFWFVAFSLLLLMLPVSCCRWAIRGVTR